MKTYTLTLHAPDTFEPGDCEQCPIGVYHDETYDWGDGDTDWETWTDCALHANRWVDCPLRTTISYDSKYDVLYYSFNMTDDSVGDDGDFGITTFHPIKNPKVITGYTIMGFKKNYNENLSARAKYNEIFDGEAYYIYSEYCEEETEETEETEKEVNYLRP